MEPRKFRTRNGTVLVEKYGPGETRGNGYTDSYIVVESATNKPKIGEYIILLVPSDGFPVGGAHGDDYDIIEEIQTIEIWIARKRTDGRLFACNGEPHRAGDQWISDDGKWIELPSTWHTDVTFENSPRRIRSQTLHRKQ